MNLMNMVRNAAAALMLFSAGLANASMLQFTITGDYTAQWQLNSTLTPDIVSDGVGFVVWDVPGFDDAALGIADLTFYHVASGGGLQIYDYWGDAIMLLSDGPQLYSGLESAPIFTLGSFALTEFQGTGAYTLTIQDISVVPVPEPETGLLFLGGLALIGGLRMRRTKR